MTLPSNASSNLFLNNFHLKDEEAWEVGLHHIVYRLSMFDITNDCKHSHTLQRQGDSTPLVLQLKPTSRPYIKTSLNFMKQTKKSCLTKALYCEYTAGHMDKVDNTAESNERLNRIAMFTPL